MEKILLAEKEIDKDLFLEKIDKKREEIDKILDDKLIEEFEKQIENIRKKQLAYVPEETKGLKRLKTLFKKEFFVEPYDPEKHGPLCVFEGVMGYKEVERYWVEEPYAFVVILYNEEENEYLYYVVEPELTPFENILLSDIKKRLQDVLLSSSTDGTDREIFLKNRVNEIIADYGLQIEPRSYYKILYYVIRDYLKLGKITPLMNDPLIEDISCNGWESPVFLYHKNYTNIQTNISFGDRELDSFVIKLAQRSGKHISMAEPLVDSNLPDGSRIQMTLGEEVTTHGSTFTIRKFREIPITPVDLIRWNTFSSEELAYLWLCIENNKSLIFVGGTASGKTSSLNAVSLSLSLTRLK